MRPSIPNDRTRRFASVVLAVLCFTVVPGRVQAAAIFDVPVLMYHRIDCPPPNAAYPHLWVCPSRFDETLRLLKANGWETITARYLSYRVSAGLSLPPRTFVITIDDGDRDGYDNGYPILEKYGYEAVFAVVVDRVRQGYSSQMTWAELKQLEATGNEVADHSMTHSDLRITGNLRWQVEFSAEILDEQLGRRPRTFVYPFGFWDSDVIDQVAASHFRMAFTTVDRCGQSWSSRFVAPRVRVDGSDTAAQVLARVSSC